MYGNSVYKKLNKKTIVSNIYFLLIVIYIILISNTNDVNGLPLSSYWSLRRRIIEIESTITHDNNEIIVVFPIINFTWDSNKFPTNGIRGYVIHANPLNACESVEPPPNGMFDEDNENVTNWFLLANNDDCDLKTKEMYADEAGFLALILPNKTSNNDTNSTTIISPEVKGTNNCDDNNNNNNSSSSDTTTQCGIEVELNSESEIETTELRNKIINIYTLKLDQNDWLLLWDNFSYPNPYIVKIEDKPSIFLFVIAITFLVLIVITIITVCVISIKRLVATIRECTRKQRIIRRNNLLISTVRSLPIRKWTRELDTLSEENKVCVICTEHFKDDEEIRVLPCCHIFHLICVDQWILEGRPFCKICNHKLLPSERLTPSSDISSDPSDTLHPVYASSESTRLLMSNSGAPGTSTLPPPPLRVMAIMPEVFDASFEAMLPLRSTPHDVEGEVNVDISTEEGNEVNQRTNNIPRNNEDSQILPSTTGKPIIVGTDSTSHNITIQNTPVHSNYSNSIYISDHEHFV